MIPLLTRVLHSRLWAAGIMAAYCFGSEPFLRDRIVVPARCLRWQEPTPVYTQPPGFHGGEGQLGFTRHEEKNTKNTLNSATVEWTKWGRVASSYLPDCLFELRQSAPEMLNSRSCTEVHLRSSKHSRVTGKSTVNDRICGQLAQSWHSVLYVQRGDKV